MGEHDSQTNTQRTAPGRRRRRAGSNASTAKPAHRCKYRQIENTLALSRAFSDDHIQTMNQEALRVLEELGIRVLLPEGRALFRAAGARVDEGSQMVFIGREIVEAALASAPKSFTLRGAHGAGRDLPFGDRSLVFGPGAGCPTASDLERGRRPGNLRDFIELTKLTQSFDVLGLNVPIVEPQDVPLKLRHYATLRAQLQLSDKPPFIFARGRAQVEQGFEAIRLARGLSQEAFESGVWATTVINSNSPRQLDIPMTQGLIEFARYNQVSIMTPFCLAGAMAPITVPGALLLSHAEALAGIALTQIVRPGAPVIYGAFSSNVDMKSGAPVFGTPEHIKTNFGAGQLARLTGLPWRSGGGTAAAWPDVQADYETQMSVWGSVLAGANLVYHAAGWLEGGLTLSYEKLITDLELLQTLAELAQPVAFDADELGFDAIAEVQPGGHFFAADHTMQRYANQFYEPLVSDWANFGQWQDSGAVQATERAQGIWKDTLEKFQAPTLDQAALGQALDYMQACEDAGGADAVS